MATAEPAAGVHPDTTRIGARQADDSHSCGQLPPPQRFEARGASRALFGPLVALSRVEHKHLAPANRDRFGRRYGARLREAGK